jgi:hypothetical protein
MLIIIAKSFQPRSKLARHPKNAGQNVSREAGWEKTGSKARPGPPFQPELPQRVEGSFSQTGR